MRRILLSALKILVSGALLYFALRKASFADLASRINVASLGWIGLAIAVTFLQIFVGVLRWREVGAECGASLTTRQAMRYNVIGAFFNQTLPSSIGGDAVGLCGVGRAAASRFCCPRRRPRISGSWQITVALAEALVGDASSSRVLRDRQPGDF